MKKKLWAGILALAMVLSLAPTALASEGGDDEEGEIQASCTCAVVCTERYVNEDCEVCNPKIRPENFTPSAVCQGKTTPVSGVNENKEDDEVGNEEGSKDDEEADNGEDSEKTESDGKSIEYADAKITETISITEKTTLTLNNVTIDVSDTYYPGISITNGAEVTLILVGDNTVTGGKGAAGIYVEEDATLTIYGPGSLTAQGGRSMIGTDLVSVPDDIANKTGVEKGYYCAGAGIGGNGVWAANDGTWLTFPHFGTVTIQSGTITAVGGKSNTRDEGAGAGIGSGGGTNWSDCEPFRGTIQINGGNITATGGEPEDTSFTLGGAGIGSGANAGGSFYTVGNQVSIAIDDGEITATGRGDGAGIGGGANVDSGYITINGGKIEANGGYEIKADGTQNSCFGGAGIGGGDMGGVNSITINGGNITATATGAAAGIGCGFGGKTPDSATGSITITGGTVNATGGGYPSTGSYGGAGIGSGASWEDHYNSVVGDITISGGKVTATAAGDGAGIGTGEKGYIGTIEPLDDDYYMIVYGTIKISGDSTEVTATGGCRYSDGAQSGGYGGAGIGSGNESACGDIIISGGKNITATATGAAAGIGSGYYGDVDSVTISGGTITATGGDGWAATDKNYASLGGAGIGGGAYALCGGITISGGENITATAIGSAAGIGGGYSGNIGTKNEDGSTTYGTITISGGKITATGGCCHNAKGQNVQYFGGAGIGGGQSGTLDAIVITGGDITAKAIGAGAGIGSSRDGTINTITISGEDTVIDATGGCGWSNGKRAYRSGGAGIGSGDNVTTGDGPTITISGGDVTATAIGAAAGIGGGCGGNGGTITISGGTVTATGGRVQSSKWNAGAGIGGGDQAGVNSVTISGGTVTATAVRAAAGIGSGTGGNMSDKSTITISGTANVTAYGGTYDSVGGAGIGGGYPCNNSDSKLYKYSFGTITIKDQATVRAYAGLNAQAIGVGTDYENGTEENVTNQITIDGTGVDVWMFNRDTTEGAFWGQTDDGTDIVRDADNTPTEMVPKEVGVVWYTTSEAQIPQSGAALYATAEETDRNTYTWAYEEPTVSVSSGSSLLTEESVPDDFTLGNWATTYPKPVTVTFDSKGGSAVAAQRVAYGGTATRPAKPEKSGYDFYDWYQDEGCTTLWNFNTPVTEDITLYARWNQNSTPSDGGTATTRYTLTVKYLCISGDDCTGGTPADSVTTYTRGTKVDLYTLPVPDWEDHFFANTYFTDAGMVHPVSEVTMDRDQTVYTAYLDLAGTVGSVELLESDDHYAYLIGYTDGTVHPLGDLSRAETATVFFRLLTTEVRDGNLTAESEFDDVTTEMWCDKAIATLARLNILKGRGEGVFDPEATITRAEFAAICARFDDSEVETGSTFSDIADCWAKTEIERAAALGWVTGYPDGTFRPYDNITRSEAATLINRMLQRLPQTAEDLLENAVTWPDAPESEWYYLAIEEATNSHAHEADEADGHERWTALTEAPDWKQYQ